MSRTRVPAIAGFATIALIAVGAAVWQWRPWESAGWVPQCSDLAPAMQSLTGGSWSVSDADSPAQYTDSSSSCSLAFSSADQQHAGTILVFTAEQSEDEARSMAEERQCFSPELSAAAPAGYAVFRACGDVVDTNVRSTVIAAKGTRWSSTTLTTSTAGQETPQQALTFAQDLLRQLTESTLGMQQQE